MIVIAVSSAGTYSRTKTAQEMEQARILAQESEFKGFDRQIKANGEQTRALQIEIHYLKMEIQNIETAKNSIIALAKEIGKIK